METAYADSWSDIAESCDMDLWVMIHEVTVSMTYISRSGDFALYLKDYSVYKHHTCGV